MQNFFKKRKIFNKIWKHIDDDRIILLNGARQVGKTTLLKLIKEKLLSEKGISEKQILWFDLEQTTSLALWSHQATALDVLSKNASQKYYLFIDEFQLAKNIGSTLKVIHDHYPHIKIIITGSASWYLNIDESMAGRKIVIPVFPLNFAEFLEWRSTAFDNKITLFNSSLKNILSLNRETITLINEQFQIFANWGGYPRVALTFNDNDKIDILNELLDSYLIRDIKIWNYKANTLEVRKLLSLLAGQVGSTLSIDRLSKNSALGRDVITNRLELLQNTFILKLISPYFTNKIKEITKSPKIYLIDSGLRNILLNIFSSPAQTPDFGHLIENVVAMELEKNKKPKEEILFWRTVRQQEVDIILKREDNLIPIEVKGGNQKTIPSGLKSFIRHYQPKEAYVLNWSVVKDEQYKNCSVYFRPIWFTSNI